MLALNPDVYKNNRLAWGIKPMAGLAPVIMSRHWWVKISFVKLVHDIFSIILKTYMIFQLVTVLWLVAPMILLMSYKSEYSQKQIDIPTLYMNDAKCIVLLDIIKLIQTFCGPLGWDKVKFNVWCYLLIAFPTKFHCSPALAITSLCSSKFFSK